MFKILKAYVLEGLVHGTRENEILEKSSSMTIESGIGTDFSSPGHTHSEDIVFLNCVFPAANGHSVRVPSLSYDSAFS